MAKHGIKLNHLSDVQLAVGIGACLMNARDLVEDAKVLFAQRRYPRTYAILQLAVEEIGKARILLVTILSEYSGNGIDLSKDFTHHILKTQSAIVLERTWLEFFFDSGTNKAAKNKYLKLQKKFKDDSINAQSFDAKKQQGFYVNVNMATGNFAIPAFVIKRNETKKMLERVQSLYQFSHLLMLSMVNDLPNLKQIISYKHNK